MDGASHPVAIIGRDGISIGTGRLLDRSGGVSDLRLRAPLWMLCLDGSTGIRLQTPDGTARRFHVREVVSMDGVMATVRVQPSERDATVGPDRLEGRSATA